MLTSYNITILLFHLLFFFFFSSNFKNVIKGPEKKTLYKKKYSIANLKQKSNSVKSKHAL
jgi:hypothetical protein